MKRIRTLIVAAISTGLIALSTIGVSAQDAEVDPMAPSVVTGHFFGGCPDFGATVTASDGVTETNPTFSCQRWETNDDRLNGANVNVGNWERYPGDGFQIAAGQFNTTNDGGSWTGVWNGIAIDAADGIEQMEIDTIILTGHGAYEGLTGYILQEWSKEPVEVRGVIFPRDMPEVPETSRGVTAIG
jgi:hypothetical protein